MSQPTKEQVNDALRAVIDPELRRSIVDLGMVRSIEIAPEGKVDVVVSLTTAGCPIRSHFQDAVVRQVSALEGVTGPGKVTHPCEWLLGAVPCADMPSP